MNTPALAQESLPVLSKKAHYRLVRKVGQGGMSVVYEAFDERLKRPVALKLLHPFLAQAPEYKARFFREAEAVARLTHPNIVQIYDVSQDEQLYIVTELLSGGTLKEKAAHINFIELPELCAMIICQVATALEHAHLKGIVHRDIKPENIMITNEGHIKLMDFGIASIGSEESLTHAGTLLGSLAHVAPEVIKGQQATLRSDLFSLSTVFFWLVTGQLPFKGDSPHALLKAIVDSPAEKVQQLSPYITDRLSNIIERGMCKDPKQRFSSANELAESIEQALLEMGLSFNLKKLTAVLRNPLQELPKFKSALLVSIKNQAEIYQETGNHALALALRCRLDIHAINPTEPSTPKKQSLWGMVVLAVGMLASASYLLLRPGPEQQVATSIALAMPEPEILASQVGPLAPEAEAPPPPPPAKPAAPAAPHEPKLPARQEVNITIWPFSNIIVDGIQLASDVKHMKLELEPGLHRLKFTHAYAATIEKVVTIKAGTEPLNLNITMNKTKPAFLVVNSSLEANVAVNGLYKGSSAKSVERPIVIPMPDRTHAQLAEIVIHRDGFEPVLLTVKFIAGQTQRIHATLVPTPMSQGDQP